MNGSSLMNINTVKKYIKKGVPWCRLPLLFGSPNAVFPRFNSNNFQPLINGLLSNETNFQTYFIQDS